MAHDRNKFGLGPFARQRVVARFQQGCFRLYLCRIVPQERYKQNAIRRLGAGNRELTREDFARFSKRLHLNATFADHMPCAFGQVAAHAFDVGLAVFQRNDQIDHRLAHDLIAAISENLFGGAVEFDNFASLVDNDHRVESRRYHRL